MPPPDVPALLSLAGHELRGPAGVLGGYLKLLSRDRAQLPERQQQIVDAADRALARLVETLDELREVQRWLRPDRPTPPVTAVVDLAAVLADAAARAPEGATVRVQPLAPRATWRGDGPALSRAVAACLEAVAREHLPPVTLQVRPALAGGIATVQIVARGSAEAAYASRALDSR